MAAFVGCEICECGVCLNIKKKSSANRYAYNFIRSMMLLIENACYTMFITGSCTCEGCGVAFLAALVGCEICECGVCLNIKKKSSANKYACNFIRSMILLISTQ